jgi:hypothetical protein
MAVRSARTAAGPAADHWIHGPGRSRSNPLASLKEDGPAQVFAGPMVQLAAYRTCLT